MSIQFVQYSLPYGQRKPIPFFAKPEIEKKAADLIEKGCEFTYEILRSGLVLITCEKNFHVISAQLVFAMYDISSAIEKIVLDAAGSQLDLFE